MARNPVGFEITNSTAGWNGADFDDVFIRKDCFLEGGLWGWGNGVFGLLGTNVPSRIASSPIQTISGGTNWKSVCASSVVSAGIKTDGTLWLWGSGYGGGIGDGTTITRSSPVQTVSGGTNWKSVTIDYNGGHAIKDDGTLWGWGNGSFGRLGNNSTISRSSPVQTVSSGTNWKSVSGRGGSGTMGAIKTDGTLWTWGYNSGFLGDNTSIHRSSPVQTVSSGTNWKSVSMVQQNGAAIKTDGTLWVWGASTYGQTGNNSLINRSSPVQTISAGTNWKQVSAGRSTIAAIKTDGSLWMWGKAGCGTLGTGDEINRSSPVQTVSGGTNWKEVTIGQDNTAAIKTNGSLWLWGYGAAGKLGNNGTFNTSSPIQTISGGTNWRTVKSNDRTTFAIREDCW